MIRSLPIWAVLIAAATPAGGAGTRRAASNLISGRGYINHDTPRLFVEFMHRRDLRGAVVVLE
jgi:hypothetical protein